MIRLLPYINFLLDNFVWKLVSENVSKVTARHQFDPAAALPDTERDFHILATPGVHLRERERERGVGERERGEGESEEGNRERDKDRERVNRVRERERGDGV